MFLVKALLIMTLPLSALLVGHFQDLSSPTSESVRDSDKSELLLEHGTPRRVQTPELSKGELKIVSYNIRYRSGEDLKKLLELFKQDPEIGNAVVLGLQEVDRHKKRSGKTNTAKLIAEELGLNYAWAAPPQADPTDEEETGVAIMSPFPITDVRRIVLPHSGPNKRRRVALGATVGIQNTNVRVYSIHSETRLAMDKKLEQMSAIVDDMKRYPPDKPVILVGDLNTWEAGAERKTIKLFSDAGLHTPFGSQTTFSRRALFIPIEFRLDWIWLRNFQVVSYGIDKKISLSDHYPLWVNVKLPEKESSR